MKTKFILLVVFAGLIGLNSCRKGEDDPFISFRSREARLTGEWKLNSGSINYSDTSGNETITYTVNSISSIYISLQYSEKWSIKKDGSFEMNSNIEGNTTKLDGYWCFGNKVKGMDLKNKEYVIFHVTSETDVDYWGNVTNINYTGIKCPIYYFIIKELRNKKMVVNSDGTYISKLNSITNDFSNASGTITYVQ